MSNIPETEKNSAKLPEREKLEARMKELLPELELIEDASLRAKVLSAWCDGMQQGGWTPDDLQEIPFTLLLNPCPGSFLDHTRSVTNVAYNAAQTLKKFFGDNIKLNMDYLVAGAILHDVGKLLEYERIEGKIVTSARGKSLRHPFSGVGIGYASGIPDEILHMIAYHSKEGDMVKRSPESTLIHHADFINFETFK